MLTRTVLMDQSGATPEELLSQLDRAKVVDWKEKNKKVKPELPKVEPDEKYIGAMDKPANYSTLPQPPKIAAGIDKQWGRERVAAWKKQSLDELQKLMDNDPEREANKKACQALWGTDLEQACPKCGRSVKWWWMENSWCSPCCEVWLYPIDRARPDGRTYTQFASDRKKIYEEKMREIEQQAAEMLKVVEG
jgi:hypothetical protein